MRIGRAKEENETMNEAIQPLIGLQVEVRVNGPEEKRSTYKGVLTRFEAPWLVIEEEGNRQYCFSVYAIVYVRPI
jgi:hypothetical protein